MVEPPRRVSPKYQGGGEGDEKKRGPARGGGGRAPGGGGGGGGGGARSLAATESSGHVRTYLSIHSFIYMSVYSAQLLG